MAEIEEFSKVRILYTWPSWIVGLIKLPQSLHTEVLDPLHVLLAIALELPEDYFTNLHKYEQKSEVRPIAIPFRFPVTEVFGLV